MAAVRFLEDRIKCDPDDIIALNKLSGYYLQLHRETDDLAYLELALGFARKSLDVLPADQNLGGLRVLAQARFETHDFAGARAYAVDLIGYEPGSSFGHQLMGDVLFELGEYEGSASAYSGMESLDPGSIATQSRLARLDLIRGDTVSARRRFEYVLAHARTARLSSEETTAWCHWQLGELEMAQGRYQQAERQYRLSLGAVKDYSHAIASLARLRAGQGDLQGAIEVFEKVLSKKTDPVDAATLGDLYRLAGKDVAATEQFSLVERVSEQTPLHSILYRRHLIRFWADHDRMTDKAYELARKEYEIRRDVYGADALAWAALKAGKIEEARSVIKEALRFGTQDARLFYHAGMIERAAGDRIASANFLRRAVKLNRLFDPWHSRIATQALKEESIVAAR